MPEPQLKRRSKGDLFYYKSTSGMEIDFIIKEGKKVSELIQVCYMLDDFVTK